MKKQYVDRYTDKKDFKEKMGMAGVVGICILAFAVTVVAGTLLLGSENPDDNDKVTVSTAQEDIKVVTNETEEVESVPTEESEEDMSKFLSPCDGELIKEYSVEMPIYSETLDDWRIHEGVDIAAPLGTAVCACADGTVKNKYNDFRYGATISIEHDGGFTTIYSNLENTDTVNIGQAVLAGEMIGKIGDTTLFETVADTHIHVEVLLGGVHVNPLNYFSLE